MLIIVMLVCIPFAWMRMSPRELKDFAQSVVAVSLFGSNILFLLESGYFNAAAELKPLLHTWSLAVEEQYYVLFPLFLMLAWRLGTRWILSALAVVAVLSLGFAEWSAHRYPDAACYLRPFRMWELLLGAFAAFHLAHKPQGLPKHARCWGKILVGVGQIGKSPFLHDREEKLFEKIGFRSRLFSCQCPQSEHSKSVGANAREYLGQEHGEQGEGKMLVNDDDRCSHRDYGNGWANYRSEHFAGLQSLEFLAQEQGEREQT